ncbi:actin [Geosmithia morbida]|uniref:Actin n=1 Tax=Geosmithia morbida TaxID=1094350 RepID=A0A9P4YRZ6_9HYPO|nr:actin [Geosmithia morbida]KAF4121665.1 actin [Geosmithia morbida]
MESATGPTLAHRSVASIRSGPSSRSQGPPPGVSTTTPHTPPRSMAVSYGSPSTMRADEDIIVLELGSRFVRAGFAGDSLPKATLQCGLDQQRRVGDFRAWQPLSTADGARSSGHIEWAAEHEIWRYDVRETDLGLIHDKLDRLIREAFSRYLLIDSKARRMALVIDSAVPLPLLSTVLDTVFGRFQTPLVSLLSPPSMSAVAAGVRSALVVDIGWTETAVTSVYEYREVKSTRTVRAGRYLLDEVYAKVLRPLITGSHGEHAAAAAEPQRVISFEESEDIMCRLMWCRAAASRSSQRDSAQLETVEEQDETDAEAPNASALPNRVTRVPLVSTSPPKTVEVSLEKMADVCDDSFFASSAQAAAFDDHELPIHTLVYKHLLQLPIDVRAICMSRIIFVGGCSNILGLKERVIDELTATVEQRGWEATSGKGVDQLRRNQKLQRRASSSSSSATGGGGGGGGGGASSPTKDAEASPVSDQSEEVRSGASSRTAAYSEPESQEDPTEAKVRKHRDQARLIQGHIRALHSLGPWAGASLTTHLKIPALATVDRDLWLQHGAGGASRPGDVDAKVQQQRQSMGPGGLVRGTGGHHANWTLGQWGVI